MNGVFKKSIEHLNNLNSLLQFSAVEDMSKQEASADILVRLLFRNWDYEIKQQCKKEWMISILSAISQGYVTIHAIIVKCLQCLTQDIFTYVQLITMNDYKILHTFLSFLEISEVSLVCLSFFKEIGITEQKEEIYMALLKYGAISSIERLISNSMNKVRAEACWLLDNLCRNSQILKHLLQNNQDLLESIFYLFQCDGEEVKIRALGLIQQLFVSKNTYVTLELLDKNQNQILIGIIGLLNSRNIISVKQALSALQTIVKLKKTDEDLQFQSFLNNFIQMRGIDAFEKMHQILNEEQLITVTQLKIFFAQYLKAKLKISLIFQEEQDILKFEKMTIM